VEADTDEARRQRRELVELLVEKIIVAENGDGGATVMITYCFGPPAGSKASLRRRFRTGSETPTCSPRK
jgi:hypothetical protein